jgi:hypothetical protein
MDLSMKQLIYLYIIYIYIYIYIFLYICEYNTVKSFMILIPRDFYSTFLGSTAIREEKSHYIVVKFWFILLS